MSYLNHMSAIRVLPIVLGLLGACVTPGDDDGGYYGGGGGDPGWGTGTGGGGGEPSSWCEADTDCVGSGQVCARDGECLDSSGVRTIHVNWTVSGQPASAAACVNAPDLMLTFFDGAVGDPDGYEFGFAPVPCPEGKFTIDKMPLVYTGIDLVRNGDETGGSDGVFDALGDVSLDLAY
jgi:hypothetical protein